MTDKEKLEKIKHLADAMYGKMQNLTTDTLGIRKAMDDYHQFVIFQYDKEEPVSEDLENASERYACRFSSSKYGHDKIKETFKDGAKWGENQAKVEIQAQSMALVHGCPEEPVSEELEEAAVEAFK